MELSAANKRAVNIVEITALFILPVLLIYTGVVPFAYRYIVLGVVTLAMLCVIYMEGWRLKQLGIRTDNLRSSLVPYAIFTLVGLIAIGIIAYFLGKQFRFDNLWRVYPAYLISVIPTCIIQEFGYRAILLSKLKLIFSSLLVAVLLDAVIFSLLHLPYPELRYLLPITFFGGIGFATMYSFYPNLIVISLAHLVLNFGIMLFSFFPGKH